MELLAPAKINLSLRIFRRRQDGFHEIATTMAPISLADRLTMTLGEQPRIDFRCDDPTLPAGSENLAVRAAEMFLERVRSNRGVSILLEKRIPHGAGLGGGSSDAASVLLGLNELLSANVSSQELIELAAKVGSDVPFFILQSAARCVGRGERVTPHSLAQNLSLLLFKPQFGVPTSWAYSRWQNSRELLEGSYEPQHFRDAEFVNDLERPVFEKFPFLAHLKMWLRQQPEVGAALLSGSGSTLFAALRDGADAAALGEKAKTALDPALWTCAAKTM